MQSALTHANIFIGADMNIQAYYSRRPDYTYRNFKDLFTDITETWKDRTAMRMKLPESKEYTNWSYADLKTMTEKTAQWLLSQGLKKGDCVAIISENRPEWCMVYFAVTMAGLVIVPIDSALEFEAVANNCKTSGAKVLFYSNQHGTKIKKVQDLDHGLSTFVCFDSIQEGMQKAVSFASIQEGTYSVTLPESKTILSSDVASIIFTSGTTGIAKGIQLTHGGIIANINASIQALDPHKEDVFISILPLHHTYATTCTFLSPLTAGGSMTFVEKLIPTVIIRHIKESKVSFLIGVPILFDKVAAGIQNEIAKLPARTKAFVYLMIKASTQAKVKANIPLGRMLLTSLRKKAGLDTIRLIVSGGGPLSKETADFYDGIGVDLVQGYGMSENGPLISVNCPLKKDNASVGYAVKNTLVRIGDADKEGVGEIQVTSPSLMKGYLNNPEATEAVFTPDHWLKTGDLGKIDRRGFIYITGRSKNLIVTEGGKNVYPEEIEQKFINITCIKEALILGRRVKKDSGGEEIIAVIVPNFEAIKAATPGKESDKDFVYGLIKEEVLKINKILPPYMKIQEFLVRETEFEKTTTLKIRRFIYQKEYAK